MVADSPEPEPRGPLHGVRVLDAGNVFASPFAATLMADLGADVVKIEAPGTGDALRGMQPHDNDESLLWSCVGRNKRSVTLDLRRPEGREVFLSLLAEQDLLLENFRPGTLDKWGLDRETLMQVNPELVVVRVSGFGQSGPNSAMAGFGTPATAFSGYVYSTGYPDRPPVIPPINLVDYIAGLFAAFGSVVALYHRDALSGRPQEVDVALYESMLRLLEGMVAEFDRLGIVRERQGNQVASAVPCGIFECADGVPMVLSTSTDRTFNRLAILMGREDMTTDQRYSSNQVRVRHREQVNGIVGDWFGGRDSDEVQKRCDEAGVPVARVNNMADVFTDRHVHARKSLVEVEHPRLGYLTMPNVVPRFSGTPGAVRSVGPALGEHTGQILTSLGLGPEEIARLAEEGVT